MPRLYRHEFGYDVSVSFVDNAHVVDGRGLLLYVETCNEEIPSSSKRALIHDARDRHSESRLAEPRVILNSASMFARLNLSDA